MFIFQSTFLVSTYGDMAWYVCECVREREKGRRVKLLACGSALLCVNVSCVKL